jgi:hypothetical protein
MLMFNRNPRRFKNNTGGGGSKKGKPQSLWPLIYIVVASALEDQWKGSWEGRVVDRNSMPFKEWEHRMAQALPGCWEIAPTVMPGRKTDLAKLLKNRPYKRDIYSGTSDRGKNHDPRTRAAVPKESWRRRITPSDPLMKIYEDLRTGRIIVVENWQEYLKF